MKTSGTRVKHLLKDIGMTVPKTIETKVLYADKGKDEYMGNNVQYEIKVGGESWHPTYITCPNIIL